MSKAGPEKRATEAPEPANSLEVRARLVEALKLDLVGPWAGHSLADERLPGWVRPSNWYLTGFLIPTGTPPQNSADADEDDDVDVIPESAGLPEESTDERKAAKKGFFPSSMGLSFLVPKEAHGITVIARWGEYTLTEIEGADGKPVAIWQRQPREETIPVALTRASDPVVYDVTNSGGLQLHIVERLISTEDLEGHIPQGTRSVSIFLVNHRTPNEENPDVAYPFQTEIEVRGDHPFVPRPDLRGVQAAEWDDQVADLHYADTPEYATGHGVSAVWEIVDGACRLLRSAWIPSAEVEKTTTVDVRGVELSMEVLGALADGAATETALRPLVGQYRAWIETRRPIIATLRGSRRDTADELLRLAGIAADRIERGITVCWLRKQTRSTRSAWRIARPTAQGKNPKVIMRKAWLALMGAAERAYRDGGGHKNEQNPADPYMTVLGYFNSLRELGGARRILEEEVQNTIKAYGARKRIGEERGLFQDRKNFSEVVELTSRVSTDKVAEARRRLEAPFHKIEQRVDCAIATNMISVGLDIQRLGLMVVLGQPKTHAEYIQATSRVGRDDERPGLVVTLLNIHKPRDRSHYERFRHYHETFYRSVEVASVTPFSARALDRGFAGTLVGLARHAEPKLTPPQGVEQIADVRAALERKLLDVFLERVRQQPIADEAEREERLRSVHNRVVDLLDSWRKIFDDYRAAGVAMQYQKYELKQPRPLLREMLDKDFESEHHRKFRANRSLRDVEPEVNLFLKDLSGMHVEDHT